MTNTPPKPLPDVGIAEIKGMETYINSFSHRPENYRATLKKIIDRFRIFVKIYTTLIRQQAIDECLAHIELVGDFCSSEEVKQQLSALKGKSQ